MLQEIFRQHLQSYQRALDIIVRLFGEEHPDTTQSYFSIGITQRALGSFFSVLQTKQSALDIRIKLFGEEHSDTAQSYLSVGITQHSSGDFLSALQSDQRALKIKVKLLGEEHQDTAQELLFHRRKTISFRQFLVSFSFPSACS